MISFANSTARKYQDKDLNRIHDILFSEGVFNSLFPEDKESWNISGDFACNPASNLDIIVKKGLLCKEVSLSGVAQKAIVNIDTDTTLTLSPNNSASDRVDTIILRIDQDVINDDEINETGSNVVTIEKLEGSSDSPMLDSSIQASIGGDVFVRLADVTVPVEASSLNAGNVSDKRELVETSGAFQNKGEIMRFTGVDTDPEFRKDYELWFNSSEGVFKYQNNGEVFTLNSSALDLYENGGVVAEQTTGNDILQNNTQENPGQFGVNTFGPVTTYGSIKSNAWQIFTAPSGNMGTLRIRKTTDGPNGGSTFTVKIRTLDPVDVDGVPQPGTVLETFTVTAADWNAVPEFGHLEITLNGGLYTSGTDYGIHMESSSFVYNDYYNRVASEVPTSDPNMGDFYTQYVAANGIYPNEWNARSYTMGMAIVESNYVQFGESSATGKNERLLQSFYASTNVVREITLKKGADVGTPTEDIRINIYKADVNDQPDGDALGFCTISKDEWDSYQINDEISIPVNIGTTIGGRYVFEIEALGNSDANHRNVWAGVINDGYSAGKLQGFNATDGYFDIDYDLWFKIRENAAGKIVVADNQGRIPEELLPGSLAVPHNQTIWSSTEAFDDPVVYSSPKGTHLVYVNKVGNDHRFRVYKLVSGTYVYLRTFLVQTCQVARVAFVDETTIILSAAHQSYDFYRAWEVDILTQGTLSYLSNSGTAIIEFAHIYQSAEIVYENGAIYCYRNTSSSWFKFENNGSIWTNTGSYNIGITQTPSSTDASGNIVLKNGDTYFMDNDLVTLVYDASGDILMAQSKFSGTATFFHTAIGNYFMRVIQSSTDFNDGDTYEIRIEQAPSSGY